MDDCQQRGTLPVTSLYLLVGKNEIEEYTWYVLQLRDTVWVKEENEKVILIHLNLLAFGTEQYLYPHYSSLSALNHSV